MKTYIVTGRGGVDNQDCHFHRAVEAESPEMAVGKVIRQRITIARGGGAIAQRAEAVFLRDGAVITFEVREDGYGDPVAVFAVTMAVSISFTLEARA